MTDTDDSTTNPMRAIGIGLALSVPFWVAILILIWSVLR